MSEKPSHTNRLAGSSSPYLLQHAHNPVDWYPWSEAAFQRALDEDKPIFLSIGYSTCHWCHVMAHESFEDAAVAALLNEHFICIKVDREERPDIDQLYMAATTTMIGRGGWPLTIVMGPDKRPFFAGTYFPRESRPGRVGMLDLLPRIVKAWETQREEIRSTADQIIAALSDTLGQPAGGSLDETVLQRAGNDFKRSYDESRGGFGPPPKFPSPQNLVFLLREAWRTGDDSLSQMAIHTLKQMRLGGIFDQIGYGFHRYSTDADWHLPHFEKMLYDQATLLIAYSEAWALARDPLFRQTMDEIHAYLMHKLRSPEGAFYSAEDADSEGEEGRFYVWDWEELQVLLGEQRLNELAPVFGLMPGGNFEDEASRTPSGLNIFDASNEASLLRLAEDPDWMETRRTLHDAREQRIHPGLDDKILADWNGLTLTALSKAAQVTGDQKYMEAASDLADFLGQKMITEDGDLYHTPLDTPDPIRAFLDDYAFVIQGFRAFYELGFDPSYLELAIRLQERQIDEFWDEKSGGFFFTREGDDELFIRQKQIYDGAMPSGNSVAAENLYYLGRIAERPEWEALSRKLTGAFYREVSQAPRGFSALLQTVQVHVSGSREVVISGEQTDLPGALAVLRKYYDPFKLTLFRPSGHPDDIEAIAGFLAYQKAIDGQLTVYICENYACQFPLTDLASLERSLQGFTKRK